MEKSHDNWVYSPDFGVLDYTGDPKAKRSRRDLRMNAHSIQLSTGISLRQIPLFARDEPNDIARPFLKWAGGKSRLLADLRRCVPPRYNRYFEPFLGGGALFFALGPTNAHLYDSNVELIHCYEMVAQFPEQLIKSLGQMKVSKENFYRIRATRPEALDDISRATRFIFLNKTCYNGLYRVNKRGEFNTPFGHYAYTSLFDAENIRAVSRRLKSATLRSDDYRIVLEFAKRGDFIYLDPPYLPVGRYADFKRYTKESFHEHDHFVLADIFRKLSDRGCYVLLSNSFHPTIASLYAGFFEHTVFAPRFVNCRGDKRGKIKELLIANFQIPIER